MVRLGFKNGEMLHVGNADVELASVQQAVAQAAIKKAQEEAAAKAAEANDGEE